MNVKKRKDWLDKWLKLELTHPQLETAQNQVYRFCCEYAKRPSRGRTLVIFGNNGTAKTHMAKKIAWWAKRIAIKLPLVQDQLGTQGNLSIPSVSYCSWPEVVDGFKKDEWQLLEDLQAASMLVVDDIGAEHDPSRIGAEKMYVLLNRREKCWNILTTNVAPQSWADNFERRIASRLYRNAEHIDLSQVPDHCAAEMIW